MSNEIVKSSAADAAQQIMQDGADRVQPQADEARDKAITELAPENRTQSIGLAQESRDKVEQQVERMQSSATEFHRS